MRKFSFLDYTNEIFTVSEENSVDIGVGYDQFRADVDAGEALPYNTGTALPDCDFAAAKNNWDELPTDERAAAFEEWHEFIEAKYEDVCNAYADGPEAVKTLVEAWKNK